MPLASECWDKTFLANLVLRCVDYMGECLPFLGELQSFNECADSLLPFPPISIALPRDSKYEDHALLASTRTELAFSKVNKHV